MSTLTVLIGAPASGKSSFASGLKPSVVSVDGIRAELTGDEKDQSVNAEAWQIATERVRTCLRAGQNVVLDATNTHAQQRRRFLQAVCQPDTTRVALVFVTLLEVCLERNSGRSRQVPEHAIQRSYQQLEESWPSLEEEFDQVILITP